MKISVRKKQTLWLFLATLMALASCSPPPVPPSRATETLPPPLLGVTYCDIDPSDLCLVGFGLEEEDKLMVLFRADDSEYADIYIRSDGPEGEIWFECQASENFPENIYCLGEPYPEGELIKLNIYSQSSDKLLAIGVFSVVIGSLPESGIVLHSTTTPVPSQNPSYPNAPATPSRPPSYPNPSYPNRTLTPTSSPAPTSTTIPEATPVLPTPILPTPTSLRQ